MNRPKKIQSFVSWLCMPLLLIAVCGAGALTGGYLRLPDRLVLLSRPDAGAPVLSVPRDMLDFGEAWVQPAFVWTLPVTNSSDHAVEVSRIVTTCSCTAVEPQVFMVEAGGTVPVQLTLDLRKQSPDAGELTRPFQVKDSERVAHPRAAGGPRTPTPT